MNFSWQRLLILAILGLYGPGVVAQESGAGGGGTGGGSSGSSSSGGTGGSGASSSFGSPSSGNSANPFSANPYLPSTPSAPSSPSTPSSAAPSFRTGEGTPPSGEPTAPGSAPGAASSFGSEQTGPNLTRTPPASFTIPGLYGQGSRQFIVGEGRLARPKFRFNGRISQGYDDNVFQTPTHGLSQRSQKQQVLVSPGSAGGPVEVEVPSGDPLVPATTQIVNIPAQKPVFRTVRIPGVAAPERVGSWVTRTSLGGDVQFATRRDLFTFDIDAGNSYYWDRPGDKSEYNGSLSLIYLRKLSGRAQFTMQLEASYQSQPNFAQINTPTSNNRGSYLTTNAKADLSYRLTPRFSSVTSVGYNSLFTQEQAQRSADFTETTVSTELRYLFSPRLTLLGEVRYSTSVHDETPLLDTTSYSLLLGGELTLTRRFKATMRLGEAFQTYTEGGDTGSSPYVETSLDYRLARGTTIQWNSRYGYEESGLVNNELIVARSGVALTQIFSPRLQASLSLNYVHTQNTAETQVVVTPAVAADPLTNTVGSPAVTKSVSVETNTDAVDSTLGVQYILSRHWIFNLNYTYTTSIGPVETSDYYRQQIFLGAQFVF